MFKEHLEEPLMMAQSARRIVDVLRIWQGNKTNDLEAFWQRTFRENVYAISQVFAVPVVLIGDGAYVGGMSVNRSSAKLADYLFAHESSKEAAVVEIKTPTTRLLGPRYRGTFRPSSELAGAVMQILDYRRELSRDHGSSITRGTLHKLEAFAPRCVVIIGNGGTELDTEQKRTAFELFRTGLRDVEVVTYDELFRKVEMLATIFGLVHTEPKVR